MKSLPLMILMVKRMKMKDIKFVVRNCISNTTDILLLLKYYVNIPNSRRTDELWTRNVKTF